MGSQFEKVEKFENDNIAIKNEIENFGKIRIRKKKFFRMPQN